VQVVREPTADVACEFLRTEIARLDAQRGRLVQIIAECEVAYQGRATSTLQRGERLVLLKPDGTLLIHTATKAKPVNWQPPGAVFDARLDDGALVLSAFRRKPEELVKIRFHAVHLLAAVPLHDDAELALVGSEADLQQLLFENPDLVEPGFAPRRRERDSARGFYDLDGADASGRRLIVEVKRTTAGVAEAQQLWRYVERLRGVDGDRADRVRGKLVAPRVADKAHRLLADHGLEWKELDWTDVLPTLERMRHSGQVGLARFGDATADEARAADQSAVGAAADATRAAAPARRAARAKRGGKKAK
jgi:hypothetical protein